MFLITMQCAVQLPALITLLAVSAPATVDMVTNRQPALRRCPTCPILIHSQLLATLMLQLLGTAIIRKSVFNILKPGGNSTYHQT